MIDGASHVDEAYARNMILSYTAQLCQRPSLTFRLELSRMGVDAALMQQRAGRTLFAAAPPPSAGILPAPAAVRIQWAETSTVSKWFVL